VPDWQRRKNVVSRRKKRPMTDSKIQSGKTFLENGVPLHEVARNLSVSIPTLYRRLPASERSEHPVFPFC
jgi:DNA invertase Pin-like site-specific DNA recombinase